MEWTPKSRVTLYLHVSVLCIILSKFCVVFDFYEQRNHNTQQHVPNFVAYGIGRHLY